MAVAVRRDHGHVLALPPARGHTGGVPTPQRRIVTVRMAIKELGVKRSTVYLWINDSSPDEVYRERLRLPDERGHMRLTLVVDVEALRDYGDRNA